MQISLLGQYSCMWETYIVSVSGMARKAGPTYASRVGQSHARVLDRLDKRSLFPVRQLSSWLPSGASR